jgi:alpha-glucoside transport system permease protein
MSTTVEAPVATSKPTAAPSRRERNPAKAGLFTRTTLSLLVFLWVTPLVGLLITSFRSRDDQAEGGWWRLFTDPASIGRLTLDNYQNAIEGRNLGDAFVNSLAIALPATFIPLLLAACAAYAFAFMQFPGRDTLFIIVVTMLIVPNFVSFVPILKIYRDLGMGGTFPAVWLFHIGFSMSLAIYILRNFMSSLPSSVIESAQIDGASQFQIFWRLVLPMSAPALASIAIFQFLWVWNDLLVALVFLGPGENAPLTVSVSQMLGQQGQGQELVTAAGLFSMIVPIVVFLSMQRFFVRGLTSGAVKG